MDVFEPQTGEVISDNADGIACWFIDTDYNEESFFVRRGCQSGKIGIVQIQAPQDHRDSARGSDGAPGIRESGDHAYFLGANDPYSALKTTLKAEIDPAAWATLNSDTSRPSTDRRGAASR